MDQIRNDGVDAVAHQEQLESEISATQQSGLRIFNAVKERSATKLFGGAAGIAIEAATQIVDARPISQGVTEDGESLTKLRQFVIKDGAKLIADLLAKNDPITTGLVRDAARSAMIRRNSDPDQHKNVSQIPGEKVDQWILQQFRTADSRLAGTIGRLRQIRW